MVSSRVTDLKQQKNPSSSLSPSDSKTAAVSPQRAAKKWSLQCEKRVGLGFLWCFGVSRLIWNKLALLPPLRHDASVAPVKMIEPHKSTADMKPNLLREGRDYVSR